jgi:hypothetical protein
MQYFIIINFILEFFINIVPIIKLYFTFFLPIYCYQFIHYLLNRVFGCFLNCVFFIINQRLINLFINLQFKEFFHF